MLRARDAPPPTALFEISRLLNTGLDRETLNVLVGLCEHGANPSALALVVKELRREAQGLQSESPGDPAPRLTS